MLRGNSGPAAAARFKILAPLGRGGFGTVYEALDTRSGERVALKELGDPSADSIARFKHEFRALADCHHANLVGLKELIEQDGRWRIVMELVPGSDFLQYVWRADNDNDAQRVARYDESRLRSALIGMTEGLRALHGFGIVHRDLKPSNVRVRPDGRAVLLDFGLATSVDPSQQSTHAMGLGTALYMAPEQAGGASLGPGVDLYALGVCLFEALTGSLPFDGDNAIKIVLDKQHVPAPNVRSLAPDAPADLADLCALLLATDPALRPSAETVLNLLQRTPQPRGSLPSSSAVEASFAGRESELAHLERALAATHQGEQCIVMVEGESGIGKSELVSEFLRRAQLRHAKLIALRGRCYENEQVAYKAFDGCIDELAKLLRRMPESECAALLPERSALLGQLFPVLRNVKAITKARSEGSAADPSARRLEAFSALSQLLSRLSEERPVVLVIDDLQWADSESFRLLNALQEQAARAPVLILITVRPRMELDDDVSAQVDALRAWKHVNVITLFGLLTQQAIALGRRLLGEHAPDALLEAIAIESQGHPLFIGELARYTRSHDIAASASLTVDAALRARIDDLDRDQRELLELAALAARPYPSAVFTSALSREIDENARELLAAKLLRQRKGNEIGCYHDRIRHASVGMIARARLPILHHQLASALEGLPDADPSEQARHWDLAGKPERASGAYEKAASRALDALAFTRAAGLFERALELDAGGSERALYLTIQRADALAWSGRSGEAAKLYQQAAEGASGEQRFALRSQAALHLMLSAKVAEGVRAAQDLLREIGFHLPRGLKVSPIRLLWESLRLRLSRHAVPGAGKPGSNVALETSSKVYYAFGVVHPLGNLLLSLQQLRRAAREGTSNDRALTVAGHGWLLAMKGLPAAARLFERARTMLPADASSEARTMYLYLAGSASISMRDYSQAARYLSEAHQIASEHCRNDPWHLTGVRYHLGITWHGLGEHRRLAIESERWLAEARERNDLIAIVLLTGMGYGTLRHLMNDAPEAAREELARAALDLPTEPYSFLHFGQLMANVNTLLYQGGSAALQLLESYEGEHRGAFLLRTRACREVLLRQKVAALLNVYLASSQQERAGLTRLVRRALKDYARLKENPFARANHLLLGAQLSAVAGRREQALADGRQAVQLFGEARFPRLCAEYVVSLLEADAPGRRRGAEILAELRAQGWQKPERAIAMYAPLHSAIGTVESRVASDPAGLLCGRYEIIGQLGRGGFGAVVEVRDVQSGRVLALKELVSKSGVSLQRFKQEFRALAELHHENIVQLEELFEHDGTWYIAMEKIDGSDFVSYARPDGAVDARRLKQATGGLVRALEALHQRGFVYRDLKPENVLVTRDGRAVLIDFGLIARRGDTGEVAPVGSIGHAAPEQLGGTTPEPALDVFGLGSCLYHALNGRPPFERGSTGLLQAPDRTLPALSVPSGLAELALLIPLMLAPRPEARPTLVEIARVLAADPGERGSKAQTGSRAAEEETEDALFAGRARERAELEAAFVRASEAGFTLALIEGESGLGKSALSQRFVAALRARSTQLLLLQGRCYENEQVAYKAFDGAIDQLARFLRDLPSASCEALLPKRAALLSQLFPVLASVRAIADAPRKGLPADPATRKREGSEALLQLLQNVAHQRAVVLTIDDLQWADSESFALLGALQKRAEALPLLVVATIRPRSEFEGAAAQELPLLEASACTRTVHLGSLEPEAASELARRLLAHRITEQRLVELVRESNGHPMFLRELVAHESSGSRPPSHALTLDDALAARLAALRPEARELVALVALADKPHPAQIYARALARSELSRDLTVPLLSQGLLRRRGDKLVCSHDRIRRTALVGLSPERRAQQAAALAAALSDESSERSAARAGTAAERARLWDEAGDRARAVAAYEEAGDHALALLTFMQAEAHYQRALALLPPQLHDARWQRLMVGRGHALVRSGRSAEAAACFQAAARDAQGEDKVRLRLLAAQHLIQSAQVDLGMRGAHELLAELGIALPAGDGAAKGRIAWERARVKLRGIKLRERPSSLADRLALEALHGLSAPVRAVSLLPGYALTVQYLRRALNAGDPQHAARALAYEGFWRSINGPLDQAELFDNAQSLASTTQEPTLIAEIHLTRGMALMAQAQFKAATTQLARAHELLLSDCPGQPWLLTTARMYLGASWFYLFNYRELDAQGGPWIEEARARNDRYAVAALTCFGMCSFRHAIAGAPEDGVEEIAQAISVWPEQPFSTIHMGAFLTSNWIFATSGRVEQQRAYLERWQPRVAHAKLMRAPFMRLTGGFIRVQNTLRAVNDERSPETSAKLAEAARELDDLARIKLPHAAPTAAYFHGCIKLLEGERAAAHALFTRAQSFFRVAPITYALGLKYLLASLEGGDTGRALRAEVDRQIEAEGWRDRRHALAMRLPIDPALLDAVIPR